jgi:ABC-type Na+ efflux pump permease subunit
LRFILLRTGVDGKRQVTVYGQYGEVKSLPENMLDKIFTALPKELANSAGIYEVFRQQHSYAENTQQPNITLKPLPRSHFSIPNQQNEQTQPQETESPIKTTEKTVSANDDSLPADKKDTISLNKKPDEQ